MRAFHYHAYQINAFPKRALQVLLELHALGPAKLLDTAGLDEVGGLGDKKRRKALNTLKECDVAVLVVDTDTAAAAMWVVGCGMSGCVLWCVWVRGEAEGLGEKLLAGNAKAAMRVAKQQRQGLGVLWLLAPGPLLGPSHFSAPPHHCTHAPDSKSGRLAEALEWESKVMEQAHKYNVSPVLLLNVKSRGLPEAQAASMLEAVAGMLDPSKQVLAGVVDEGGC